MCRYKHLERLGLKARDRKKITFERPFNGYFLQVVHVPFGDNAQ